MQFILIAYDGKDEHALERRLAAREAHIKMARELFEKDKLLFASAILDDADTMIGSVMICDFNSREDMQSEWLDKEPYIIGNVWQNIEIKRAKVAPFCLGK